MIHVAIGFVSNIDMIETLKRILRAPLKIFTSCKERRFEVKKKRSFKEQQ